MRMVPPRPYARGISLDVHQQTTIFPLASANYNFSPSSPQHHKNCSTVILPDMNSYQGGSTYDQTIPHDVINTPTRHWNTSKYLRMMPPPSPYYHNDIMYISRHSCIYMMYHRHYNI